MPRTLWWPYGGWRFLTSEVPLYCRFVWDPFAATLRGEYYECPDEILAFEEEWTDAIGTDRALISPPLDHIPLHSLVFSLADWLRLWPPAPNLRVARISSGVASISPPRMFLACYSEFSQLFQEDEVL